MRQLHLDCADVNARGRHVYEKAGFFLEGHARDSSTDRRRDPDTGVPSYPVNSSLSDAPAARLLLCETFLLTVWGDNVTASRKK